MGHYIRGEKWHNPIPYRLGWRVRQNASLVGNIQTAIDTYQAKTNVRFVQRSKEKEYIFFVGLTKGKKPKKPNTGGNSDIGKGEGGGGKVRCRLSPNSSVYVVMHEIGHALGLKHEQQRRDRNSYVTIDFRKIRKSKRNNFRMTKKGKGHRVGKYDCCSIMHYGPDFYSKKAGDINMTRKSGVPVSECPYLGGIVLTATDIATINKIVH